MDEGHRWAIETFGSHGVHIRTRVAALVREEHAASVDAQEASGHRSRSVYGEFWRGILERFEELGTGPHATLVRPGRAPYKVPVVNGVALFPWRFGRTREEHLGSTLFAVSDARVAMFGLDSSTAQGELDLGMPGPGLSPEEQELADTVEAAIKNGAVTANKVVVVPVSSSSLALHSMGWGEATLTSDGRLEWLFFEDLMEVGATGPVGAVDSGKTFVAGEPPAKGLRLQSETDDETGATASDDD